jgi:hypothetical protein
MWEMNGYLTLGVCERAIVSTVVVVLGDDSPDTKLTSDA